MKSNAITNWAVGKAIDQTIEVAYTVAPRCLTKHKHALAIKDLIKQEKRADKVALEAAGNIGTEVHRAIADFLMANINGLAGIVVERSISELAIEPFRKWREWWGSTGMKPILVEHPVWNGFSGYAGTVDCVAEDKDGKKVLLDWKTSSGVYPDHHLQLAAYLGAGEGNREFPAIDRAVIVHIPKTGGKIVEHPLGELYKSQIVSPSDLQDAFIGLLEAWRILH
jgi:hypothetical protein